MFEFRLKFVPKGPINDILALGQMMAWRRPGDKPLSEPTSCVHKWGQYTPALITTHLIQKYRIKISILQSYATQVGKINWANSF